MENIYLFIGNAIEWEDMLIFLDADEAMQMSIKYPNARVEIFNKTHIGYAPSYIYYKNGSLVGV